MRAMKSITLFALITLLSSTLGACQMGTEPDEMDADFVWRVCNEHEEYTMNNLIVIGLDDKKGYRDSLKIEEIYPQKCSSYHEGLHEGEFPPWGFSYKQNKEEHFIIYLVVYEAVRGLVDSTSVKDTPGKYTYHTNYDGDRLSPASVEIEREKYF